jgi:hypothetical protein
MITRKWPKKRVPKSGWFNMVYWCEDLQEWRMRTEVYANVWK